MKKIVDGVEYDLTPEEEAERLAQEAEWEAGRLDRENAEIDRIRREVFVAETDPLQYETAVQFKARVAEIKVRFPYRTE